MPPCNGWLAWAKKGRTKVRPTFPKVTATAKEGRPAILLARTESHLRLHWISSRTRIHLSALPGQREAEIYYDANCTATLAPRRSMSTVLSTVLEALHGRPTNVPKTSRQAPPVYSAPSLKTP